MSRKQDRADYNNLREGYEALTEAHAKLLREFEIRLGESRYPLDLPEDVTVDVIDKLMEII